MLFVVLGLLAGQKVVIGLSALYSTEADCML